jgi:hypothetical protein
VNICEQLMQFFRSQFDKLQCYGDRDHHQGETVQRQGEHVLSQGKEVVIGITVKDALSKVSLKRSLGLRAQYHT